MSNLFLHCALVPLLFHRFSVSAVFNSPLGVTPQSRLVVAGFAGLLGLAEAGGRALAQSATEPRKFGAVLVGAGMRAASAVSGGLGFRRPARHAGRDGRVDEQTSGASREQRQDLGVDESCAGASGCAGERLCIVCSGFYSAWGFGLFGTSSDTFLSRACGTRASLLSPRVVLKSLSCSRPSEKVCGMARRSHP